VSATVTALYHCYWP